MHPSITRSLGLIALLSITVTIAACCDRQFQEQSKITVAKATPTPAASPSAESYPATLAEGVDFTKPGYPTFIAGVTGMSAYEPWGRWTDGDKAIFHFAQPLPKQFTLIVQANVFGPNLGEAVKVKIGAAQQEFKITEQGQIHRLNFTLSKPANTIELFIPKPTSPKDLQLSEDPRKLGLGLIKLQITP